MRPKEYGREFSISPQSRMSENEGDLEIRIRMPEFEGRISSGKTPLTEDIRGWPWPGVASGGGGRRRRRGRGGYAGRGGEEPGAWRGSSAREERGQTGAP